MRKAIIAVIVSAALLLTGCGAGGRMPETAKAPESGRTSAVTEAVTMEQTTEMSAEAVYRSAMQELRSGDPMKGIRMLAEVPAYGDARAYLWGYEAAEPFLGVWEADLGKDFARGGNLYPKSFRIEFSLKGMEIGKFGSQFTDPSYREKYQVKFPAQISCSYTEDGRQKTVNAETEVWIGIDKDSGRGTSSDRACFYLPDSDVYLNLFDKDGTGKTMFCQFIKETLTSPEDVSTFYCSRRTEPVSEKLDWRARYAAAAESGARDETSRPSQAAAEADLSQASVRTAVAYLRTLAFSRKGLIEQLEYEGFTHAEAVYGADHCGANWMEQAVLSAKSYLKSSAFSYKGLKEQLEFEGFTSSEATHGADRCGANWNEQAVRMAKQYLKTMSFSRSDLIDQLVFEGFTRSQAEYGVREAY